jgi:hypothetical protein
MPRPVRAGLLLAATALALLQPETARAQPPSAPPLALAGAPGLRLSVIDLPGDPSAALDPAASLWEQAPATTLLLSRTPRLYQTEPADLPEPPSAEVRAVRASSRLVVRLSWTDAIADAPRAPEARTGEAGAPDLINRRPTGSTSGFSDAAAVMLPEKWTGPAFPSLVMGDEKTAAILYLWTASRGGEVMRANGRATTKRLGQPFPSKAAHDQGRWTATLEIPAPAIETGYPVAFAIWDGHRGDRDGMKFFSVWYVLAPQRSPSGPAPGSAKP